MRDIDVGDCIRTWRNQVAAGDHRCCIQREEYSGDTGDCSFASYQQCQAAASRRMSYCGTNLNFCERYPNPSYPVASSLMLWSRSYAS
jgi:Protein of unknown function (DUF3551)